MPCDRFVKGLGDSLQHPIFELQNQWPSLHIKLANLAIYREHLYLTAFIYPLTFNMLPVKQQCK